MSPLIAAAILAAGASRRLGRPKQLVPARGTTLLRAIAEQACASSCDRIAVVVGAHAERIVPTLDGLPLAMQIYTFWPEGVASSIRSAAAWAWRMRADALVLLVGDQPRLATAHVDALCDVFRKTARSVGSRYAGIVGVPAVFTADQLPQLVALGGDTGARRVLLAAAPEIVDWPDGELDIDTPEQLALSRRRTS